MSIKYTTDRARKQIRSAQDWQKWVATIQDKDRVIVQQFIPAGDYGNCIQSQVECWRFWDAEIRFTSDHKDSSDFTVWYDHDIHHPYKHGHAVYWNIDIHDGDVFGTRIVPFHSDLVKEDRRFLDFHAPVWEENWKFRCFILVKNQRGFSQICNEVQKIAYLRCYSREVDEGQLFTAFGDRDAIFDSISNIPAAQFLYSEYVA